MDKTLLKAYIRTIVEEEVNRILPNILGEAIAQIKGTQQVNETITTTSKPKLDRSTLAAMMGLERQGDTITATTKSMILPENIPQGVNLNDPSVQPAVEAITRDYSATMKKLGLTK
jgi:hypothetical protein